MKRLFIALFIGIFLISFTSAWSSSTFNNSLTAENLTFTGNQNITRWLSIPNTVSALINGHLNLSGYIYSCYQESVNISNQKGTDGDCGLNYTGNIGGYWLPSSLLYDGNWDYEEVTGNSTGVYGYMNYTKPLNSVGARWKVRDNDGQVIVNILDSCFSFDSDTLILRAYSKLIDVPGSGEYRWECYNGGWNILRQDTGASPDARLYEEAIYWDITYPSSPYISINNTKIWNHSGEFNSTFSPNKTINLASIINNYISTATAVAGYYLIPFIFHSDTIGILEYASLIFNDLGYFENLRTYNSPVLMGALENIKINLTYGTSYTGAYTILNYDGTNYTMSSSDSGHTREFEYDLIVPTVSTEENKTFYFTVVLSNSTGTYYYNTNSSNQTVNPIAINSTCTGMYLLYNFTMADERTQSKLNGVSNDTIIKIDLTMYNSARTISLIEYHGEFLQTNPVPICINNNLSGGETYSLDVQIQYGATNYSTELYHIERYNLNSSSLAQNITLYDLDTDHTQKFTLLARDSSYLPIDGALIQVERKYIENGTFYITEIPKTNARGITSASLETEDVIYNFKIYQAGVLVSTFTNVLAICQTPLVSRCEIDFNAFQTGISIPDYEEGDDFNFTLGYNRTSRVISSQFVIPSGTAALIELKVIREDSLGTSVCTDSLIAVSGTLSCLVPSSFGNSTVTAILYKAGVEQGRGSFVLDQSPSDIFGVILIFLSILVMMTLIGVGISDNPIVTIIFVVVGFILLMSMNLVQNTGFIGATATILFLIIAVIIFIIKAARRN